MSKAIIENLNSTERINKLSFLSTDYIDWTGKKKVNTNSKDFKLYNRGELKSGRSTVIGFSNNKIYNIATDRFINRDTIYTKTGQLREKYNKAGIVIRDDTFLDINQYLEPLKKKVIYAEANNKEDSFKINKTMINGNLKNLLSILNPTTNKYILTNEETGRIYTLSNSFLQLITDIFNEGGEEVVVGAVKKGSDYELITAFIEHDNWTLTILEKPSGGILIDGAFFPFLHKLDKVDLDAYGVYKTVDHNNYEDNCLIKAIETAGYDTTAIKCLCKNQYIPMKELKNIANKLNLYITVRRITDEKKKEHYGDNTKPEIKLGIIEKHYFLIQETNYTRYSIENYEQVKDLKDFNRISKVNSTSGKYKYSNERFIDSYKVIKILVDNKHIYLEPIKYTEELYKTNKYKEVNLFGKLDYNNNIFDYEDEEPNGNLMVNKPAGQRYEIVLNTFYFDFETTTARNDKEDTIHKPYCLYTDKHPRGFFGRDCGRQFLNYLVSKYGVEKGDFYNKIVEKKDGTTFKKIIDKHEETMNGKRFIRLIAHNSSYDFRFILKYLYNLDTIEKGTGLMNATANYTANGKTIAIQVRDSLKMINMPLRQFGSCFGLDQEKEVMPYDLYTEENIKINYLDIDYCLSFVKESDKKQYLENCNKWECIDNNKINILKYSGKYCFIDCLVLKAGYEKFRELVEKGIGLDITNYMTLPSMANDYLVIEGCYDGVYKLSGVPRHFIQQCVVGGRTMCRRNEKFVIKNQPLADFDAVSLYPSAMSRMAGFPLGKPKIITDFNLIKNTADAFYIAIKITSLKKNYDFPCQSLMTETGIRNFTNDLIGKTIYIDNIALEDLVRFQAVEYDFINGYYFDEGMNNKINTVIRHLFNQRLKYKKEKNPLQLVFKELMNSSYGKSCLKPIDTDSYYIKVEDFKDYIIKNYHYVKEATLLSNKKFYKVKLIKTIDTHFNNVHVGVLILSMSKRIMFEVMTLAEDLDIDMYYTDTDSIHIDESKINYLGEEFRKKYNRELIGNGLGQFHTDFDLDGAVGDIIASESVFLGKKCYIDKITGKDKDGKELVDYHIRMKGVNSNSIRVKANQEYNGDLVQLYEDLYKGKKIEFDLLTGGPSFQLNKDMTIKSRKKFTRAIQF